MIVLYLDLDCFYVQAEITRRPDLRGKPVVIQQVQHGGFIAISYEARKAGIRRGDGVGTKAPRSIQACLQRCPGLQIVPVDMPHNRYVSQEVEKYLRTISPNITLQRNSIDDFCIECSGEIAHRIEMVKKNEGMDMYNEPFEVNFLHKETECTIRSDPISLPAFADRWQLPVQAQMLSEPYLYACYVGREIQSALYNNMNITSSIGIAQSKVISRLIVSMNKPFQMTLFPDYEDINVLLRSIPIIEVHGLRGLAGSAIQQKIQEVLGEEKPLPTLFSLQTFTQEELHALFGDRLGSYLAKIRLGLDFEKIEDRGPLKSILVELSFPEITQTVDIFRQLRSLMEDLLHRIIEHTRRYRRRIPKKMTIKWRRGAELSMGSQVFMAPKSVSSLCHEAVDKPDEISSKLQYFTPALDQCMSQCMTILLRVLQRYPSVKLTGNRQLNRLGVVANAFSDESKYGSLLSFLAPEVTPESPVSDSMKSDDVEHAIKSPSNGTQAHAENSMLKALPPLGVNVIESEIEGPRITLTPKHETLTIREISKVPEVTNGIATVFRVNEINGVTDDPSTKDCPADNVDFDTRSSTLLLLSETTACWKPELPAGMCPSTLPAPIPLCFRGRRERAIDLSLPGNTCVTSENKARHDKTPSESIVKAPSSQKRSRQKQLQLAPRKKSRPSQAQMTLYEWWKKDG